MNLVNTANVIVFISCLKFHLLITIDANGNRVIFLVLLQNKMRDLFWAKQCKF